MKMASTCSLLRTGGLIVYLIFHVQASVNKASDTELHSLKVVRVLHDGINCKYLLNVSGSEFLGHHSWRLTSEEGPKGGKCEVSYPNYEIKEVETSQWFSKVEVSIPYADVKIFFCLHQTRRNSPFGADWVHQGVEHFLEPKNDVESLNKDKLTIGDETKQNKSQVQKTETQDIQHQKDVPDEHNVKISINNDVQETKTDWADLTHDTDVNYLPSAPRPTREEKNDIEVLYQHRYVPLNDLIEQIKTKHKLNDVFDNEIRNDIEPNSIKLNSIIDMDKNSVDTIHEDRNNIGNSLNDGNNAADNVKFIVKRNNTEDIRGLELDVIQAKLESPKREKIIAEMKHVLNELNSLPNYTTVREILARVFPNYMSIKKKLADQYVQEIIEKSLNEILEQNLAKTFPEKSLNDGNNAADNVKFIVKHNNTEDIRDLELDVIQAKLESPKREKIIAEMKHVLKELNSLPNYTTVREILARVFPNYMSIKKKLADQYVQEIIEKSLNEILEQNLAKTFPEKSLNDGNNAADNVKFIVKHNNTEDIRDLELEVIQAKLESPKREKIIAEMKHVLKELNSLPNYTTVREILARVFPNYMSIKKKLADQYVQEIIEKSLNEILEQNLAKTFPENNFFQEKLLRSPEDISVQNILDDSFPKEIMEIILVNRAPENHFSIKNLMRSLRQAKSEIDLTESALSTRKYRQAKAQVGSPESIKNWTPIQAKTKDISELLLNVRKRREVDFTSVRAGSQQIVIEGVRIEDSDKEPKIVDDGIPSVLAESSVTLRVYGDGLTPHTVIAFTHDPQPFGQPCKFLVKGEYMIKEGSLQARTALFDIRPPAPITESKLYICAKNLRPGVSDPTLDEEKYLHQGTETWKMVATHNQLLPLWVSISLILFCLMFSALFSGLNLGLMSLDRTELKIISNTGTEQERKYARAIMPVRDHGNYLLCSILLGNVAVNSTFTILLDELTSGLFAVIFSTLAIVLLGEITPQAICSRHGLMVGAKSIMVTKGVMALTAPLSFPVSKLLDYFLGEEIGNVYNRERLKELVKVTTDVNDLDKDEVNIISGALEMRKKTVKDVMTKLEDVFMLPISSVLDFETMSEIVKSGYSRIPVYEGGRGNIVTVLFIKDLAFVDPDDNTPLRTLCQYYQNAAHFVFEDVTLDVMFKQFKDGHKGHMAFVHRINNEGEGDPFYETIGLVTLEDVIEEMIQSEIVDETDVFLDNRSKRRRRPQNKLQDFAAFAERHENQRIHISPQLTLATFQFLSTSVDAFRPDTVSETVLRRLLRQDVIQYIKIKGKTKKDPATFVFQQGKPVDYFLLILEGRVEVTVGRENLVFEAGPFTYFGVQALTQNIGVAESPTPSAMGSLQNINMDAMLRHTFVPDYSVRAITSLYYLTVKRSLYLAAKRATLMEKGNISKGGTTQEFDTEVDKLLQSVDEDLSITGEHKTPSRQVSPHPMPVPPSPRALEPRNGHAYAPTTSDEQERLLK